MIFQFFFLSKLITLYTYHFESHNFQSTFGTYTYTSSTHCYSKKELTSIYKSVSIYTCYNHNLLRLLFNEIEAWNMSMNMALYLNDIGPEFPVSCNSGNNVYRRFLSHVFKNNTQTFIFTSNKKNL